MSEPIKIQGGNFEQEVLQSSVPVLVDFGADWCGPCQRLAPFIDELARDFSGRAKVAKVDVDTNQGLATRYSVMSVPTLVIFKDGQEFKKWIGFTSKDTLARGLEEALR
jgi:thioredoxin 1